MNEDEHGAAIVQAPASGGTGPPSPMSKNGRENLEKLDCTAPKLHDE